MKQEIVFLITIYLCRPPNIIFKQQPTSSSLGMGKASHEGGSQDTRIPTSSSNPLNVSLTPNGHDSRANQVSNFSSTHALNLPSSNSQGFQKANSSSFFDTQSLNSGKKIIRYTTECHTKMTHF